MNICSACLLCDPLSHARSIVWAPPPGAATCLLQNAVVFQSYGTAGRLLQQLEGKAGGAVRPQLDDQQQPMQEQQQQAAQQRQLLSLSQVFWAGCAAGLVQTVSCCWPLSWLHAPIRDTVWPLSCLRALSPAVPRSGCAAFNWLAVRHPRPCHCMGGHAKHVGPDCPPGRLVWCQWSC